MFLKWLNSTRNGTTYDCHTCNRHFSIEWVSAKKVVFRNSMAKTNRVYVASSIVSYSDWKVLK